MFYIPQRPYLAIGTVLSPSLLISCVASDGLSLTATRCGGGGVCCPSKGSLRDQVVYPHTVQDMHNAGVTDKVLILLLERLLGRL
jgi:hypothetical protein